MNIENYINQEKIIGVSGLFFASGDFDTVEGKVDYEITTEDATTQYCYQNEKVKVCAKFIREKNGVVVRKDYIQNISENRITINGLLSRFCLDGNEYEVYTQYNGWQHENKGGWQPLITQVTASSCGIRSCDGATPIMGLHNVYTQKNMVFHLMPNAQWKMTVKKFPIMEKEYVVLETGFQEAGLHLTVEKGEIIELPTIIYYQANNKIDLDAYKLHAYYNEKFPRKQLPILYNSWLYCFDVLDIDKLKQQVDCAAEMGIEAFMIDAGWFGEGADWYSSVGDWTENLKGGPCGRLLELSEYIREKNMIFGLWFEPERASASSKSVKAHPEYYIDNTFLDFSNENARKYILDVICEQIEKYHIGWVKFDFNATTPYDATGTAFYRYLCGQKLFVEEIKERYPNLYITNCASGGQRMDLWQGVISDSFWLSDNQGPYEGIRIVKDALKRLPTGLIERWNVQKYCKNIPVYGEKMEGKLIHCNDATWSFLIGIRDSFSEAFMQGGPLGFSCDIAGFPKKYKSRWKKVIEKYKKERDFFAKATARILVDIESIIVIEYADELFNKCVVQIFTKNVYAKNLIIYPVLEKDAIYVKDKEKIAGSRIMEEGLFIDRLENNSCVTITLKKK